MEDRKGLSPHTRGSPLRCGLLVRPAGSIPAHAGEPFSFSFYILPFRVYPRTRGGALTSRTPVMLSAGLSPHTRGSHLGPRTGRVLHRSIPAHAGEPRTGRCISGSRTVYPRTRGGAKDARFPWSGRLGLSPHTRGSPSIWTSGIARTGSIPAHAGEPPTDRDNPRSPEVYPRTRGGADLPDGAEKLDKGLSPHTRGSLLCYK